jgi:hypothetical protein
MNPWRAYFLLLQDLARWTSTHGGMISSYLHGDEIPQMDVVTPTRGKKTLEICTRKKQGHHLGGTLADLDPRGSFFSTWTLTFESL